MQIDEPHRGSAFDSPGLASIASYPGLMCCVGHNAIGVALFYFHLFKRRVGAEGVHEGDEPHRGSAFDSPGLASVASYPGLIR